MVKAKSIPSRQHGLVAAVLGASIALAMQLVPCGASAGQTTGSTPAKSVRYVVSYTIEQGGGQKHTVSFNANGAKGYTALVTYAIGSTFAFPPSPKRPGYIFKGWYTAAKGGTRITSSTKVSSTSPTVLYARWQGTYFVSFKANGGEGTMARQKFVRDKTAKLRKNAFTRSGWTFAGWSLRKSGAVAYKNAAPVTNLAKAAKTRSLYAVWAKPKYNVAFYANGGKGVMDEQSFTYGKAKKLSANTFTKKGHTFAGWATSEANARKGKVAYKDNAKVKNLVTTGKTVKLYAVWKKS